MLSDQSDILANEIKAPMLSLALLPSPFGL